MMETGLVLRSAGWLGVGALVSYLAASCGGRMGLDSDAGVGGTGSDDLQLDAGGSSASGGSGEAGEASDGGPDPIRVDAGPVDPPPVVDAGPDVIPGGDAGPDAEPPPTDAGPDAEPPPTDAGPDAEPPPTDAGPDAEPPPTDAGPDAEPPPSDAGPDAESPPTDAGPDVTPPPTPPSLRWMAVEGRNSVMHETLYALHFGSDGVDRSHELTPVDAYVEVDSVSWSPDGSRLAFVTDDLDTLEYHAYVVDFAADYPPEAAPLDLDLQLHEYAMIHAWCGSGAVIIRDSEPDMLATSWTWVDVTNPNVTLDLGRVTGSSDVVTALPSPTGDVLFVETTSDGQSFGVHFVRLDGSSGSSELVEIMSSTPGITRWSPSGEFFVNVRTGAASGGFYPPDLYDLRGPTAQLVPVDVPADGNVVDVMWAPDGRHVTYRVSRPEAVSGNYFMDLLVVDPTDGSFVTHHRTDTEVGYAAWTGQGDGLMFSESYQDQFELFWADRRTSPAEVHQLYTSPLSDQPSAVLLDPGGTEVFVRITAADDTTELQRYRFMPSVEPAFVVATALEASSSLISLPPAGSRAALTSSSSPPELVLLDLLQGASQNPYAVVQQPEEARTAWLPDGSGLIVYALVDNVDASQLWWLDAASDAPSLVEITDRIGGLGLVEHAMPEGWE